VIGHNEKNVPLNEKHVSKISVFAINKLVQHINLQKSYFQKTSGQKLTFCLCNKILDLNYYHICICMQNKESKTYSIQCKQKSMKKGNLSSISSELALKRHLKITEVKSVAV